MPLALRRCSIEWVDGVWTRGVKLPTLKRVLSAGAPVSGRVLERFAQLLGPDAEIHTPYGATEALRSAPSRCGSFARKPAMTRHAGAECASGDRCHR